MEKTLTIPAIAKLRTYGYQISSWIQLRYYRRVWGMDLGDDLKISRSARLDRTNPTGIHIGGSTLISFEAAILTHDFVGGTHRDTYIGTHCFVGARAVVMPGVRIGDHCVIGAGSVVTQNIPSNSIAVGNPARVIRSNVTTGRWGIMAPDFLRTEHV
jgi:acetyltransferase-like isoleucine patch superfamily enzyme